MGRVKQKQFKLNQSVDTIIEEGKDFYCSCSGKWNSEFFKNENPITLELACGKGEYSVGQGRLYHDRNFIGIDISSEYLEIAEERISKASYQPSLFTMPQPEQWQPVPMFGD